MVIPARNESQSLPKLLTSLNQQDYLHLPDTRVFVADANSTDSTAEMARSFAAKFPIEVLPGGLPSVGRNAGARRATTPYVLFLDADVELRDPTLLRRAVCAMQRHQLHCLTTNIRCIDGSAADRLLFGGSNVCQKLSRWAAPFATGMFMMFDREEFQRLGGFNEHALYAEDYLLSKQVARKRFAVIPGAVMTSNRRFQKMGHMHIAKMFLKTALNSSNQSYFLRDQGYWEES
ncbi:MAG TPA: glycosyltransferase [Acidobacteriaceae bacterium]|nr:glycosyltransferase [Acidobacteriaceae bacterium]